MKPSLKARCGLSPPKLFAAGKRALLALNGPGTVKSPTDGYACQVKVEILYGEPALAEVPATDALYQLWKSAGDELGMRVNLQERGGDGNLIWDAVPTLTAGPLGRQRSLFGA